MPARSLPHASAPHFAAGTRPSPGSSSRAFAHWLDERVRSRFGPLGDPEVLRSLIGQNHGREHANRAATKHDATPFCNRTAQGFARHLNSMNANSKRFGQRRIFVADIIAQRIKIAL